MFMITLDFENQKIILYYFFIADDALARKESVQPLALIEII